MICVAVTYVIKAGHEDEVAALFRRLTVPTRAEPGCRMYLVHRSPPDQVIRSANAFFSGQVDLVVLRIDEAKVRVPIRWESPPGSDERFPHLYGPLDIEAVIDVVPLELDGSGSFVLKAPS